MDRETFLRSVPNRPGAPAQCWDWAGPPKHSGYGGVMVQGRWTYAHRVAYELFIGPIAPALQIDHLCRNRLCVRPSHLEAVPQVVNILRGNGWSGRKARQTECVHGHPFDAENTAIIGSGRRRCRACHRISERIRRRNEVAA